MPKVNNPRMKKTMEYRKGSGDFPAMSKPRYTRKEKYRGVALASRVV